MARTSGVDLGLAERVVTGTRHRRAPPGGEVAVEVETLGRGAASGP